MIKWYKNGKFEPETNSKNENDQFLTINDIKKLKIPFKYNGFTMVEWFDVYLYDSFSSIKSGLNHADGKTLSPYYYSDIQIGHDHIKKSEKNFNNWYKKLNVDKNESKYD